jgi:DegV family protein with EDD domain
VLRYLDGKRLRKAVNAGWLWLNQHRERLNAINVFPVADGDTGTNMSQTLRSAALGANSARSNSLGDVADAIAIYSLRGAQGNSGVILSQYFKGVAEHIGNRRKIYSDDLAGTFSAGADSAYRSVKEPREGTILTVLREIAEQAEKTRTYRKNISQMIESAIAHGKKILSSTKYKLKALSDADVVDAGGLGFVHFMEGIHHLISKGEIDRAISIEPEETDVPRRVEKHSRFRFCSEYLIRGHNYNIEEIERRLEGIGDSTIVAGTAFGKESYLRIHIHTDNPDEVEMLARSVGILEMRKVEDMVKQNREMRGWRARYRRNTTRVVRIVTDSTCDLPPDLAAFHDIEIVPLKVAFDSEVYRDGIDLDNHSFYEKLSLSKMLPRTSQPSPHEFAERYREALDRGDCAQVLSIHLSSKLSGTFNSASSAAQDNGKVTCFDSGTVSLGLGLMVIAASEMAAKGYDLSMILAKLESIRQNQGLIFTLGSIQYLIKGGRVGRARGFLGRLLGLRPVLILDDGEVHPVARVRSEEKAIEKIVSLLPKDGVGYRWAVAHAAFPRYIELSQRILRERFGINDVLAGEVGPTVGTHAGPGTWGIFYMKG